MAGAQHPQRQGEAGAAGLVGQAVQQRGAVAAGHVAVADHGGHRLAAPLQQGLVGIGSLQHAVAGRPQQLGQQQARQRVIVDQQHQAGWAGAGRIGLRGGHARGGQQRQAHHHLGALAGLAAQADLALHGLGQALADGQTQAVAALAGRQGGGRMRAAKGREQLRLPLGRNADAGVLHRQAQPAVAHRRSAIGGRLAIEHRAHQHLASGRVLHRIAHQVGQQLAQAQRVQAGLGRQRGRQLQLQHQAARLRRQPVRLDDLLQQRGQRHRRRMQREAA